MLEQILTHEDILYNIIPNTECCTPLREIVTNIDSVVILVNDISEPFILDKVSGRILGTLEEEFVGTGYFIIHSDTEYIIETNYKCVYDVYAKLPIYS